MVAFQGLGLWDADGRCCIPGRRVGAILIIQMQKRICVIGAHLSVRSGDSGSGGLSGLQRAENFPHQSGSPVDQSTIKLDEGGSC